MSLMPHQESVGYSKCSYLLLHDFFQSLHHLLLTVFYSVLLDHKGIDACGGSSVAICSIPRPLGKETICIYMYVGLLSKPARSLKYGWTFGTEDFVITYLPHRSHVGSQQPQSQPLWVHGSAGDQKKGIVYNNTVWLGMSFVLLTQIIYAGYEQRMGGRWYISVQG